MSAVEVHAAVEAVELAKQSSRLALLLVGITTAMTIQFQPEWSGAAMYVLMAVILLIRPRGLFGERWERFE